MTASRCTKFVVPTAIACLAIGTHGVSAQDAFDDAKAADEIIWPRVFTQAGYEIAVFQPQFDAWENYELLTARAAISILAIPDEAADEPPPPVYGAIYIQADTESNLEAGEVLLENFTIIDVVLPQQADGNQANLEAVVRSITPRNNRIVLSLERILADLDRSTHETREVDASFDPPPIFHSGSPAVLLIFTGKPDFQPVDDEGDLLFAVNTNWDVFLDQKTWRYFLLYENYWFTANDLVNGPWIAAFSFPESMRTLPRGDNWNDVRLTVPSTAGGAVAMKVPRVIMTREPAELIVTDGTPTPELVPHTELLHITNTESDLFIHTDETGGGTYYFLTAGRWFRAPTLNGPWEAATQDLPATFANIPPDHERGHVLASVPGTPDADAAVLLASIPRKATVTREGTTIEVEYDGEPEFAPISGTTIEFAINTQDDVFRVEESYYCCHQGIWFLATDATGPWVVADAVPDVIYTIPSTSPGYHVTYVHVYESTPETVVVGQTAGYTGQYIAAGLVVFGLAYAIAEADDIYFRYHSGVHYYAYGSGVRYDYHHGGFHRTAWVSYGPYGGAGRRASYNPGTGTYSRGAARYGPRGGAFARTAYNPHTGNAAAQVSARTPYGSWGRTVVSNGDDWARAGHRSGVRGDFVGAAGSEGGAIVAGANRWGNSGFAARDRDGDLYVGRNGNVFKRDSDGGWSRRAGGSWNRGQVGDRSAGLNRNHQSRRVGNRRAGRMGGSRVGGRRR